MAAPDPDVVDLWTIDLQPAGGDASVLARAAATLDAAERARAERIVAAGARARFVLARAGLRAVLGGYLRVAAAQVPLGVQEGGKPFLTSQAGLSFSLAHSRALAVVAVATRAAIGVDVELLGRPITPALMRRALDELELEHVLSEPRERRDEAFLRHWTVKEAYVKALGGGIWMGMRAVAVRDVAATPSLAGAVGDWSVQRFDPRPGAVGAVVVAGGPWTARRRDLATVAFDSGPGCAGSL